MGPLLNLFKKKKISMEERLKRIKEGVKEEREKFISDYTPFIIKTITQVTNKYIEVENDDEYSVGLEAFNEAIDKYDFEKGSFLNYAEIVIRSRIYDFMRRKKPYDNDISIDKATEEGLGVVVELKNKDFTEKYEVKEQIEKFKVHLKEFDIDMEELIKESPKHIDTRLNAIEIAKLIVNNEDMLEDLYRKKMLPAKKIMNKLGVSRKVLKGSRKFIIATALIIDSELEVLKGYISQVERRADNGL